MSGFDYSWDDPKAKKYKNFFECCLATLVVRGESYDTPDVNLQRIASMWKEYIGADVSKYDVAIMMAMLKLARLCHAHSEDSLVDAVGYIALAQAMAEKGVDY